MIVVMAYGYARRAGSTAPGLTGPAVGTPQGARARSEMAKVFEDDVTQALIPFIDKNYRTLSDRDNRAMAGAFDAVSRPSSITLRSPRSVLAHRRVQRHWRDAR